MSASSLGEGRRRSLDASAHKMTAAKIEKWNAITSAFSVWPTRRSSIIAIDVDSAAKTATAIVVVEVGPDVGLEVVIALLANDTIVASEPKTNAGRTMKTTPTS